jgi:hypothetical protein
MSHKMRLKRLENMGSGDRLWALIGIGKPRDSQHQKMLEARARQSFYASGGNREAASLLKRSQTIPSLSGKTNGTPSRWNQQLRKTEGVCSLNRSGTCSFLWKSS